MAQMTVRQAAEQVGVSRQTMFRKIKDGTVSATVDHQGQKQIDSAELLRVFGALQAPGVAPATGNDRQRLTQGVAKFKQARDGRLQDVAEERTEAVTVTTWTWRLTPARVREHEALIVAVAKQRDEAGLAAELQALAMMPLFSGIRGQVLKLYGEAKKLSGKFKLQPPTIPTLPYLVKLPVYATPPTTIADLQGSAQNLDRRVR